MVGTTKSSVVTYNAKLTRSERSERSSVAVGYLNFKGVNMKRFVRIEIEVEDGCETACSEHCLFYNHEKYYCPLFQSNIQPIDNFKKRERCRECLKQEVN
jgi:hypothetical protein